jgi:hypothetical protein
MTIPQHPFRSQWQPIGISMIGYRVVDTIEAAALEAIYAFCSQHPEEVIGQPLVCLLQQILVGQNGTSG